MGVFIVFILGIVSCIIMFVQISAHNPTHFESTERLDHDKLLKRIYTEKGQWYCNMSHGGAIYKPCFNAKTGEYAYGVNASEGVKHGAKAIVGVPIDSED